MATTKKITKAQKQEFIRNQLKTNPEWAKRALLRIYDRQTEDEKATGETVYYNNIGFSGADSGILSSFAEQLKSRGWLSNKQMSILMKRMYRYSRQIVEISDQKKLERLVVVNV